MALLNPAGWAAPTGPLRWLCVVVLMAGGLSSPAQVPGSREYQVKAVFLFNFAQFVEWPAGAFAAPDAPLIVGVLGDDPFGPLLDEVVRDEKVAAHPIEVRRSRQLADLQSCHVLFISRSESSRIEAIIGALETRSVLTVSDAERAAYRGIMIRFLHENNRVRLRVNLDATRGAGLTISSKILRAAEIVGGTP